MNATVAQQTQPDCDLTDRELDEASEALARCRDKTGFIREWEIHAMEDGSRYLYVTAGGLFRPHLTIARGFAGRYAILGDGDDLDGEGVIVEADTLTEALAILPS